MTPEDLISISHFSGTGYQPLVVFETWRVAVLRHCDELLPEQIDKFECHTETDEVFILVQGRCILFLANVEDGVIQKIHAVDMEPKKLYNVRKGVYHTHTLDKDAHVIIVENQDTGAENSLSLFLDHSHTVEIREITKNLWRA